MEAASTTHPEQAPAARDDSRTCEYCRTSFLRRRKWQRFCSDACRTESNARGNESGIEARISKFSVLKSGELSLVVRVAPEHRHSFEQLAPGAVLKVVRP